MIDILYTISLSCEKGIKGRIQHSKLILISKESRNISFLLVRGLITAVDEERGKAYRITEKGRSLLRDYVKVRDKLS